MSLEPPRAARKERGRGREIRRVLWVTLILNVAVAVAKIVAGAASATLSLLADGYHSLMDASGNVIGLATVRFAHKPPDEDHQYGHRKFEVLASMAVSMLLFATAFEILAEAWERFHQADSSNPSWGALAVALVTLGVNIFVTRYEGSAGRRLRSPLLLADARHTLSDVFTTLAVLAAIAARQAGVVWADPLIAAGIAGFIVWAGWRILTSGVDVVADRRVIDPGEIQRVVLSFDGARGCRRIRTRGFEDAAFLDLTVLLDAHLSLQQAHDLCDRIEAALQEAHPELVDIVIHPEPDPAGGAA